LRSLEQDQVCHWTITPADVRIQVADQVEAIALAFLRNRASAPRDISAGAAKAFRGAIDLVMRGIY
jgi:hypothetical protein